MDECGAPPLKWMDVLETGIPALDDDHRGLIEQCNALNAAMSGGGSWRGVVGAAKALADRCTAHFRAEEALLEASDFPRRARHEVQHRRIEAQFGELVAFLTQVDGSQPEHRNAAASMRDTLLDILFRHDLDYKSHLQHVAGR